MLADSYLQLSLGLRILECEVDEIYRMESRTGSVYTVPLQLLMADSDCQISKFGKRW